MMMLLLYCEILAKTLEAAVSAFDHVHVCMKQYYKVSSSFIVLGLFGL
jgi:hypothetical protein